VEGPTTLVSYRYDGDGRRIKKTVGSSITNYFYDGANCIAETDGAGSLKAVYVYGIELISKKDTQGTLYYLYDTIGNTVATTDSSGDIVARYSYDAFGKIRFQTPPSESHNHNLFVGSHGILYDDEDELHYMRARYYDPTLGRFISRDQIANVEKPLSGNVKYFV
jgi:RHS repeat-associated protein